MLANELTISYLKLSEIRPYENSSRKHSRSKISKLKKLIRHYGQRVPIFVDDQHNIVDGHAVYEALTALGYEQVAVIAVTVLTPPEIKALRLALNRISQESHWDNEKLQKEFSELVALSFDMDLTAFDTVEIDAALNLDVPETNVIDDSDAIPQAEDKPVSARGDVWSCGRHRIACGDALDQESVATLLAGEPARMGFIDPPYNIPIDGFVSGLGRKRHREFAQASGEMSEEEYVRFLDKALRNLEGCLVDGALLFVCMDWRHLSFLKIISGCIDGAVQPGSAWRGWRLSVGPLDARAHFSVKPSACAHDCNTPHKRREFAAGASR